MHVSKAFTFTPGKRPTCSTGLGFERRGIFFRNTNPAGGFFGFHVGLGTRVSSFSAPRKTAAVGSSPRCAGPPRQGSAQGARPQRKRRLLLGSPSPSLGEHHDFKSQEQSWHMSAHELYNMARLDGAMKSFGSLTSYHSYPSVPFLRPPSDSHLDPARSVLPPRAARRTRTRLAGGLDHAEPRGRLRPERPTAAGDGRHAGGRGAEVGSLGEGPKR